MQSKTASEDSMADTAANKRNTICITNVIENAANREVLHYEAVMMSTNVQHVCTEYDIF